MERGVTPAIRNVIEPVRFLICEACERPFVALNEHGRRFCSPRCRNRMNVRAFRARAKSG